MQQTRGKMASQTEGKERKARRPTAAKRAVQSEKRNLRNRIFKSQVRTAMRAFQEASASGDSTAITARLSEVYSLMDKGVKKGVYKANKANRTKSRITPRVAAQA